jgi:hypothetical protein
MDKSHQPDIMVTLGRSLLLRRMQLGYGERQRRRFLDERGPTSVDYKTIARLEQGAGHVPDKVTSAEVESLYGLAPGSFRDSIVTGNLVPAPVTDPVWDELRGAIMALPWLTDAEKGSVVAHVRRLRRAEVAPQAALPELGTAPRGAFR